MTEPKVGQLWSRIQVHKRPPKSDAIWHETRRVAVVLPDRVGYQDLSERNGCYTFVRRAEWDQWADGAKLEG